MKNKKRNERRSPARTTGQAGALGVADGSEFPFATAWRRRWFTIPQITDFIRGEIVVDLGNGCPISRRERERNKLLDYIASRLEAVTTKSAEDIPF